MFTRMGTTRARCDEGDDLADFDVDAEMAWSVAIIKLYILQV